MSVRAAIVSFPGSNCEQDCERVLRGLGAEVVRVWHDATDLGGCDLVVLPGGFAHGDYLRPGAIARFSPVMQAVADHAASGGLVAGICNGFQVLCEAGLLPGALRRNAGLRFICRWVEVRVDNADTALTARAGPGQVLRLPINHFEGNYHVDASTLEAMRRRGRVTLRYVDNPNGSLDAIAGICNDAGNVFGLMPHPERACDPLLGSGDGALLFGSLLDAARGRVAV